MDQLRYQRWIVIGFEIVSSLKINLHTSKLILVGKVGKVEEVDSSLSSLLGCKIGRLPTSYHNLPLGVSHKSFVV